MSWQRGKSGNGSYKYSSNYRIKPGFHELAISLDSEWPEGQNSFFDKTDAS